MGLSIIIIKKALFFAGCAILLALGISLLFTNFNMGFLALACGACGLIVYGIFVEKLIRMKWLNISLPVLCVVFLATVMFLAAYGRSDNATFDEDAAIVLGAGIRGERVTRLLAYRLDRAASYAEQNPAAVIVVSGGQGAGESITEALAMERYLLAKGIAAERIIKEEKATSTYENLSFSKELLDKRFTGPYRVTVITNDFHIYRASLLAGKQGLDATHAHAPIIWHSIPVNYTREFLAVLKTWIVGR